MPWTERNAQGGVGVRDEQFTRRLARPRAAGANGHPGVNGDWTEVRPRNRTQDRKKRKKKCAACSVIAEKQPGGYFLQQQQQQQQQQNAKCKMMEKEQH